MIKIQLREKNKILDFEIDFAIKEFPNSYFESMKEFKEDENFIFPPLDYVEDHFLTLINNYLIYKYKENANNLKITCFNNYVLKRTGNWYREDVKKSLEYLMINNEYEKYTEKDYVYNVVGHFCFNEKTAEEFIEYCMYNVNPIIKHSYEYNNKNEKKRHIENNYDDVNMNCIKIKNIEDFIRMKYNDYSLRILDEQLITYTYIFKYVYHNNINFSIFPFTTHTSSVYILNNFEVYEHQKHHRFDDTRCINAAEFFIRTNLLLIKPNYFMINIK